MLDLHRCSGYKCFVDNILAKVRMVMSEDLSCVLKARYDQDKFSLTLWKTDLVN